MLNSVYFLKKYTTINMYKKLSNIILRISAQETFGEEK